MSTLALPDPEHLRPTLGTNTLCCRLPILHGDLLGTLDLNLLPALETKCGHRFTSKLIWHNPSQASHSTVTFNSNVQSSFRPYVFMVCLFQHGRITNLSRLPLKTR